MPERRNPFAADEISQTPGKQKNSDWSWKRRFVASRTGLVYFPFGVLLRDCTKVRCCGTNICMLFFSQGHLPKVESVACISLPGMWEIFQNRIEILLDTIVPSVQDQILLTPTTN
jgi:hypothetical protein